MKILLLFADRFLGGGMESKMNILICDDIKDEAEKLTSLLGNSGFDVNTSVFYNASEALAHIRSGAAVDVCFLDIVMPGMSGVAFAESLRQDGFSGEIVFLTTSNEYAAESYTVKAFSYLLKPLSPDRVRDVLSDLENKRLSGERDGICVKTSGKTRFILLRDISHVEVIKHTIYFRMINGAEIEAHAPLSEVAAQLLRDPRFVRCHRSYIVNVDDIEAVTGQEITMQCGTRVPISRSYPKIKDEFLRRVLEDE